MVNREIIPKWGAMFFSPDGPHWDPRWRAAGRDPRQLRRGAAHGGAAVVCGGAAEGSDKGAMVKTII